VIEKQFEYGAVPRATVLSQRNQVAQVAATVAPLEKALAAAQHQLSVLAGSCRARRACRSSRWTR
jgi:outer membrane protein TolC